MTGGRPSEPEQDASAVVEGEIGKASDIVNREMGAASDVVEGEIGQARLRTPDEVERDGAGADLEAVGVTGPDDPLQPTAEDEDTEMDRLREASEQQ
jgi:hypothetical protein